MATPVLDDSGHVVMEHLVENDGLDEIAGDPRLIEDGVDSNQLLLREVCAELQ